MDVGSHVAAANRAADREWMRRQNEMYDTTGDIPGGGTRDDESAMFGHVRLTQTNGYVAGADITGAQREALYRGYGPLTDEAAFARVNAPMRSCRSATVD